MNKAVLTILTLVVLSFKGYSQSTDDILNVLVQKNLIAQKEADSIRAEAAIAAQANLAKVKSFPVNATKKITLCGLYTGALPGVGTNRCH